MNESNPFPNQKRIICENSLYSFETQKKLLAKQRKSQQLQVQYVVLSSPLQRVQSA